MYGEYSRRAYLDEVLGSEKETEAIGKLRVDADLKYLYQGLYSGKGRPKRYAGKVNLSELDMTYWQDEGSLEEHPEVEVFRGVMWHVSLARKLTVAST